MDWHTYIDMDPQILQGKPVVRGTRLSVEFLLGLLGAGWTRDQVLASYPTLTADSLAAACTFASESLRDMSFYPLPSPPSP